MWNLPHLSTALTGSPYLVPLIGLISCGLAFFVGLRLFAGRRPESDLPMECDFLQGVNRDRRGAARRKGNTVEVLVSLGQDQPEIKGWVIDRSQGGLCLLLPQAITEKTVVRVRPRSASEQVPWTDVTVRSCREERGQYEVGCQFHRTPTFNLLLQFG